MFLQKIDLGFNLHLCRRICLHKNATNVTKICGPQFAITTCIEYRTTCFSFNDNYNTFNKH